MIRISVVFMFALMWVTTISAQKVPVILTAGQSNADGRVTLDDLPDELKEYSYCLWSYGSGDFETASGEFSPYFPRVAKPKIEQSWGFDAASQRARHGVLCSVCCGTVCCRRA